MAKKVERESVPLSRFGVLVAQLESIVASAPQQPPDALLCFDLLSDLVSVIDDEPKVLTYPDQTTGSQNRLAIPVLSQVKGLPSSNDPYVDLSKLEFEIGVCATLHLSQIVQACPDNYFQMDDFAFVAMELCVKYQYEIFQSADAITQDQQSCKELISALFVTAETIV